MPIYGHGQNVLEPFHNIWVCRGEISDNNLEPYRNISICCIMEAVIKSVYVRTILKHLNMLHNSSGHLSYSIGAIQQYVHMSHYRIPSYSSFRMDHMTTSTYILL